MEELKEENDDSSKMTRSSGPSSDEICCLMQQIGLPALRIAADTMEVAAFNGLFADLVASTGIGDYRLWFVDAVLPSMFKDEKAAWSAPAARFEPANAFVRFTLRDGVKKGFEMRSTGMIKQESFRQLIVCVFVPLSGESAWTKYESWLARGQAIERSRIRNELHQNVSQKLLAAAFGCKLLAGKVEGLDKSFAQEAAELADLLNSAVVDLQNLTRPGQK